MERDEAAFDYYFRANRGEVAQFVPEGVKRVLDVGCAAGGFGNVVKSRGAEVWGIEPNPEVAADAAKKLDRVFTGTLRDVESELPVSSFDLITFNDVLEHMVDCDQVLKDVRRLLAPSGQVLASVPNIRHWAALMQIVWRGDFPYQDEGIFDRTHVRFFTHKSMLHMFDACGYDVVLCQGINGDVGRKLKIANFLTRGRFWDSEFLQFVILARPKVGQSDVAPL